MSRPDAVTSRDGGSRSGAPDGPDTPSRRDGVVRAASEVVGGPAGTHLAARTTRGLVGSGLLGAVPLLALASCATTGLALLTRAHCRTTGWKSPDQFVHACYSDVPTLVATGAASGQPPGTALLLRVLSVLTSPGAPVARSVFDASVLLAALALIAATWCAARTASPRRWDAALLALCPAIVTAGLVSVDLVAVAAVAGALLAWARGRTLAAGALIGVAASIRPPVAVLLVALWLGVLVRDGRRAARSGDEPPDDTAADDPLLDGDLVDARAGADDPIADDLGAADADVTDDRPDWVPAATATVGALIAGVAATLLARIASPGLPGGSTWLALDGGAGYGSVWLLPSLASRALSPRAVELLCALALVVVLLAGTAAAARTAQTSPDGRAHLPSVALVLLAGVLALGPSVPVQATLVVVPLALLAAPRWRDHLPWALTEVVYATVTWLYLYTLSSSDQRGAPSWMYAVVTLARLAALGWLALTGVRTADGSTGGERGTEGRVDGRAAGWAGGWAPDRVGDDAGGERRTGVPDPLRAFGEPCGRSDRGVVAAR